jgi:Lrp/AsnC family transcriptional regulator, leucine-responsive regulatory protein
VDDVDRAILGLLSRNGRMSARLVGVKLKLPPASVYRRVRNLEERGVIHRFEAMVDPVAVGLGLTMFVGATPRRDAPDIDVPAVLSSMPEVESCHVVAGPDSYLLLVRAADLESTKSTLARIEREAMVTTRVTMILSTENIGQVGRAVTAPG